MTVTALLFAADPQLGTVAWHQYDVEVVGLTVRVVLVWPAMGLDVSPEAPTYHCSVRFGPPLAEALKNVDEPCVIVRLEGVTLICGARQLTVT
ncbi:MAG TPA: hypothetical protein VHU41_20125, partial [Thermoanaerobaculia bacterium]|nr:hypothetical protein [Thermoanaerobaculia bacterium]